MRRYTLYKYSTRLVAVLLALMLLMSCIPAALAAESGSCGDNLSWSFADGTLTITGSGDMSDFPESTMAPWYHLREEILRVELPDGLTSIGMLAFYGCENIKTVVIPDSVTRIGGYAFAGCSGMEMLNLGSGVRDIAQSAFSDCYALASLRLPDSLQTIGMQAFYRCESITTLTVPSGVTEIGVSAFAYCKALVSANVQAQLTTIPEWMLYGCERLVSVTLPDSTDTISEFAFRGCSSLNTVYYDGGSKTADEIQSLINKDVPGFDSTGLVSNGQENSTVTSGKATENEDGTVTQENTTVNRGENATVSTTVTNTHPADTTGGNYSADITVTVEDENGWEEAKDALEESLKNYNDSVTNSNGTAGQVEITVYVKDTDSIDQEVVDSVAGRDVTVTVVTQEGSSWKIDCSEMDSQELSGAYDLRYTLSFAPEDLCQRMNVQKGYLLQFSSEAQVNAELMIRMSTDVARQNATLFQEDGGELIRYQTVMVDGEGCAHFYLGSVTNTADYYIGINVPDLEDEVIIPQVMQGEFGIDYAEPVEYVITGRTSSWGMNIGQVTWILVGVMVGAVVIVGFVMFLLNKRRLKNGYIPPMDEY